MAESIRPSQQKAYPGFLQDIADVSVEMKSIWGVMFEVVRFAAHKHILIKTLAYMDCRAGRILARSHQRKSESKSCAVGTAFADVCTGLSAWSVVCMGEGHG